MPAVLGDNIFESSPTEDGVGTPVLTTELFCRGEVPAGPLLPGAGDGVIVTCGIADGEAPGIGAANFRVSMLSASQVHHAAHCTG
jgi:hypothetical protein